MTLRAEPITKPVAFHGEGPVWLGGPAGLRWVDQLNGDILSLDESGAVTRAHVGKVAAVIRPRRRGGTVIATERALLLDDGDGRPGRALPDVFKDPSVRFNEGGCDPHGRLYVGTMAYDEAPGRGKLYRFDADHSVSVVLADVTVSNGLAWSPDGLVAYYIDSGTCRVDCFDYTSDGTLGNRRSFVDIAAEHGIPDGLAVDSDGGVWVALWGGSAVHRYTAAGDLDEVVTVPVSHVTACTFGGTDLTELYVTTSARGLDAEDEPLAGSLFRCTPGTRGLPVIAYAG
ncbi:MAG: SMP-30/gluconolactonase/LRE family protein [Nocardioidaceae bacterium]